MKTLLPVVAATAATLSWVCVTQTFAQEPPPIAVARDVKNMTEDGVEHANQEVLKQLNDLHKNVREIVGDALFLNRRSEGGIWGKSLVIRSHDMDAKQQGNLQEDLAVMTHILDKAVATKIDDAEPGRTAMGISVVFPPGEGRVRNLYLDGYGALFILNVNFPLLPPPAKQKVEKESEPQDSTWEEARRELYGDQRSSYSPSEAVPKFDPQKVSALEDALLESLKDAANIRDLKPDDWVTVCVFGSAGRQARKHAVVTSGGSFGGGFGGGGGGGGGGSTGGQQGGGGGFGAISTPDGAFPFAIAGRDDGPAGKTTMTIRIKKADAEAFAKGKLTADEFRKAAIITVY